MQRLPAPRGFIVSSDPPVHSFWNELDTLRERSNRPALSEIALLAQKAGLSVSEALFQIRRLSEFRNMGSDDIADALAILISSICSSGGPIKVLEYTAIPSLLTVSLSESLGLPLILFLIHSSQRR